MTLRYSAPLVLLLFSTVLTGIVSGSPLPYTYHDDYGPLDLSWGFPDSSHIEMEFSLPSEIYIGIGFGDTSSDCDMVIGFAYNNGTFHVGDYFDFGQRPPHDDAELGGVNDVVPISGSVEDGVTTVRFRRRMVTGDKWDADIKRGLMDIVYAWCSEDWCHAEYVGEFVHHGPNSWNIATVDFSGETSGNTNIRIN